MALSNNTKSNYKYVYLSPSSKDKDGNKVKPYFRVSRVDSTGKISETDEKPSGVDGRLSKISFRDTEYNGATISQVKIHVTDDVNKEVYVIDFGYRLATRALFNSLLNLKTYSNVSIEIYESKKGYETFALKQGEELIRWKYELKDLPEPEEIKDSRGVLVKTDFFKVDNFFKTHLQELANLLSGGQTQTTIAVAESSPEATKKEVLSSEEVPF